MAVTRKVFHLTAGAVMLMFCSLPYSWAMFAAPVIRTFGWSAEAVGFTFSMGLAGFCVGGIVSGILHSRYGIRPVLLSGTLLMTAGFFTLTLMSELLSLYLGCSVWAPGFSTTERSAGLWFFFPVMRVGFQACC